MHSLRALRLLRTRQLLPNNLARATAATSTSTCPKEGVPQNVPDNVPAPTTAEEEERDRVPPPFAPSPKLESREVGPADARAPSFQQKRRLSAAARALEEATCVGVDGAAPLSAAGAEAPAPAPAKEEEEEEGGDDNVEYYREHKPSPLSQVEVADTRKPINRGVVVVGGVEGGGEGRGVLVRETVDDALARAEAMFREAAARGDPDLPHSRALARLLRQRQERFGGGGGSYRI